MPQPLPQRGQAPMQSPAMVPVRDERGRIVTVLNPNTRRPWYSRVTVEPDPRSIETHRGRWLCWWDTLDSLARFVSEATGLRVRSPGFLRLPWAAGGAELTVRQKLDTVQSA